MIFLPGLWGSIQPSGPCADLIPLLAFVFITRGTFTSTSSSSLGGSVIGCWIDEIVVLVALFFFSSAEVERNDHWVFFCEWIGERTVPLVIGGYANYTNFTLIGCLAAVVGDVIMIDYHVGKIVMGVMAWWRRSVQIAGFGGLCNVILKEKCEPISEKNIQPILNLCWSMKTMLVFIFQIFPMLCWKHLNLK